MELTTTITKIAKDNNTKYRKRRTRGHIRLTQTILTVIKHKTTCRSDSPGNNLETAYTKLYTKIKSHLVNMAKCEYLIEKFNNSVKDQKKFWKQ